jgi:hypothetical protein
LLQQVNGWRKILFWGRLRRSSSGGCAAYMYYYVLWLADFCIFLFTFYYYTVYCLILCIAWYYVLLDIDCCWSITGRLLHFLHILLSYCVLIITDWRCLTLPALKLLLVIVLSVLCGWVPLYWRTYLLMSDSDCVRRPNRLMHAWACGTSVADW